MDEVNHVLVEEVGQGGNNGVVVPRFHWDAPRSGFILRRFADLVSEGLKTDKGFKEVHCNAVAKDLAEFAEVLVCGNQVYNHLRKWRAKWDHPKDAEFLNTLILHYQAMEAIFGGGVATGRYAMGSNEPLDIPEAKTINLDANTPVHPDEDPVTVETKPKSEPTKKG
ncbi:hypothetical protein U9M48_009075 [Paspalum notatum var. saurae]|uniref:Uncharacterized protein n=1 Tax=Paspalum notatum var. saurae TaxID=547442 RepID=A0AAQ3SQV2_PASNO